MAKTIGQLLGLPALTEAVNETLSGLPQEKFLPAAFKNLTQEVIGNSVLAVLLKGQRKVSKLVKYGAPPVGAPLETIADQSWILYASSENIPIDPITFQNLRAYDSWELQRKGEMEIGRQIGLFVKKQMNLQSTITMMQLNKGLTYWDVNGNLLPTSSGAFETIGSIGISANNQNQCNGLIDTTWANPNANIPLMVRKIKKQCLFDTGYELEQAMYGQNVPTYIQKNSYCMDYLARDPSMRSKFLTTNEIPDGFLDLKWVPAWKAFYEDYTETNRQIMDSDGVTFYPEPSRDWYELDLGSTYVPKTLNVIPDVDAMMSNLETKYGIYSYGHINMMPVSLTIVSGNVFLPNIKNPGVLFQAIVAF